MPLPVIADTMRVAFEWNCGGALATNVMHFQDTSDDVTNTNTVIQSHVTHNMWALTNNSAIIEELNIRLLDGTDPGHIFSTGGGTDWNGEGGTDYIPQSCAIIKLNTTHGGRRGSGRIFLPFIAEGNQDIGIVNPTQQALVQTAWETFYSDCFADGVILGVASYTAAAFYPLQSLKVENSVATQRRRWKRH